MSLFDKLVSPWWRLLFGLPALAIGFLFMTSASGDQALENAFAAAKPCSPAQTQTAISSPQDCMATLQMTLESGSKWIGVHEGSGPSPAGVTVGSPEGRLSLDITVDLMQFSALHVGDTVVVTVWRGMGVIFQDGNIQSYTSHYPVGAASKDRSLAPAALLLGGLLVLSAIAQIALHPPKWTLRRTRRTPARQLVPLNQAQFASAQQRAHYAALMQQTWSGGAAQPAEREIYHVGGNGPGGASGAGGSGAAG